jgi:ankyrin repeat protein
MVVFELFDPQPEVTKEEVAALKQSVAKLNALAFFVAEVPKQSPKRAVFTCVYDKNCTELYKAIEQGKWSNVAHFLDTGSWLGINLIPDFSPQSQCITVVTRLDDQSFAIWSRLPLHLAILQAAPLSIIGRLVELSPETISSPDYKGDLALHLAMYANASDEILAYLLDIYPQGVNVKNALGYTPLECALKVSKNPDTIRRAKIIQVFLKRGPLKRMTPKGTGFSCDYDTNCSPLYKKIEEGEWLAVVDFLETGRWEPANWFFDTILDFFSITRGPPSSTPNEQAKTFVINRNDKATMIWARLPLHRALISKAPLGVIRPLVDAYPKSVTVQDNRGMLPLHLAMYYGLDDRVVEFLLERAPKASSVYGMDMKDPTRIALDGTSPHRGEVLRSFIQHYRAAPPPTIVTGPFVAEPAVTEPVVAEPVVTEPAVTEPVVTEPADFTGASTTDDDEERQESSE